MLPSAPCSHTLIVYAFLLKSGTEFRIHTKLQPIDMKPPILNRKSEQFLHPRSRHVFDSWQSWHEADAKWRLRSGGISADGMNHSSSSTLWPGRELPCAWHPVHGLFTGPVTHQSMRSLLALLICLLRSISCHLTVMHTWSIKWSCRN
jgi:hypothetical protein